MKHSLFATALLVGATVPLLAAPASPPALRDLNGTLHQPLAAGTARGVALVFVANDCPISNSYAPELNRLAARCKAQNVLLYLVNTDTHVTTEAVKKHAQDYKLTAPTLLDPQHTLTRFAGATVTPEAVVYTAAGALVYRGRIDNKYVDFGKSRPQATTHDLQDALAAWAAHKSVAPRETKAVGCYI